MNNKKGISDVVTTVLIVLLSLVAVAIVWSFLSPLITKSGTQISQTQACLNANLEVTNCKLDSVTTYNVTVHRSAGTAEVTGMTLKLIFAKADGTSNSSIAYPAPEELETALYPVTVGFDAENVAVAAGIPDAKGDINYCTPSQPVAC
jgi:hypothetical protein